jgi:5-methylcytosine-specific restriction endonuclease McrA
MAGLLFPKPASRYAIKAERQKLEQANEREVYAAVTLRDESCCRVCGKFCNPRAIGLLVKAHHHHLIYRSAQGVTDTWNVCLLDAKCHDDEHTGKLQLSGDADLRDPVTGRLAGIKVERPTDGVMQVIAWV